MEKQKLNPNNYQASPKAKDDSNIRRLALLGLQEINRQKAYANIVLASYIKQYGLSDLDRRFFTELVYGVIRRKNYLDAIIEHFCKKKINKLSPVVVELLRLGLYQLIYMDKVPHSAAVNESVKLAKKFTKGGVERFVNAILRNYLRRQEEVSIDALAKSESERLAYLYNQPLWLVKLWVKEYGLDRASELFAYFNGKPLLVGRINTLRASKEAVISDLECQGVSFEESTLLEEALYLDLSEGALHDTKCIVEGKVAIMDEASMAVAHVVSPKKGERILDCCAAPGGKSFHMAALMDNQGEILSFDIHDHKIALLEANATRLGVTIVEARVKDALTLHPEDIGYFDKVLVDAPCSGLGVLQKKLDMRWRKEETSLSELPELQLAILEKAANCLKEKGVLVYSTCTLNRKENEGVVEAFLEKHSNFVLEDASSYLPFTAKGPMVTLYPDVHNTDGFFMARMRKESL